MWAKPQADGGFQFCLKSIRNKLAAHCPLLSHGEVYWALGALDSLERQEGIDLCKAVNTAYISYSSLCVHCKTCYCKYTGLVLITYRRVSIKYEYMTTSPLPALYIKSEEIKYIKELNVMFKYDQMWRFLVIRKFYRFL